MINRDIHKISEKNLYRAYKLFFNTFSSEPRLKILNLLRKKKRNVSEITGGLKMDQSSVSHNLSRLKHCGFVIQETKGKFRYYKINEKTIKPLLELIDNHMNKYCIHILHEVRGGKEK